MKRILIFIFSCFPLLLPAQNYRTICTSGLTFYKDFTWNFKGYRIDSIQLPGTGDTIFISFYTIRSNPGQNCLDTTGGSILGRRIYQKHDGWYYFFNKSNDTLFLKSQAALNDSWKFCNLPGNCHLQATLVSIQNDSLLGITDSVKTISLQAKNNSNQNIAHPFNGRTIRLSKHFGLSQFYDTYHFPDDTTTYRIAGKTNDSLGVQNLSPAAVFDFMAGDVFHFHESSAIVKFYSTLTDRIIKILPGKKKIMDNVLVYQVEECFRTILWYYYEPNDSIYSFYHDTTSLVYDLTGFSHAFYKLPDEFLPYDTLNFYRVASHFGFKTGTMNGREEKSVDTAYYEAIDTTPCWIVNWGFDVKITNTYTRGLGHTYYERYLSEGGPYLDYSRSQLVYYEKGSETWGTPVAVDCNALVNVPGAKETDQPELLVIPNPVESQAQILIKNIRSLDQPVILIYDQLGRVVFRQKAETPSFLFERNNIPSGLYILKLTNRNGENLSMVKILIK